MESPKISTLAVSICSPSVNLILKEKIAAQTVQNRFDDLTSPQIFVTTMRRHKCPMHESVELVMLVLVNFLRHLDDINLKLNCLRNESIFGCGECSAIMLDTISIT